MFLIFFDLLWITLKGTQFFPSLLLCQVVALLSQDSAHKLLILSGLSEEESGDLLFHRGLFSAQHLRRIIKEQVQRFTHTKTCRIFFPMIWKIKSLAIACLWNRTCRSEGPTHKWRRQYPDRKQTNCLNMVNKCGTKGSVFVTTLSYYQTIFISTSVKLSWVMSFLCKVN